MDFSFTPEQDELRAQARSYLAANPKPAWDELAGLGWTGVSVAEADGGAGLSFVEEAILFEEMGFALTQAPFWSTVAVVLPALPAGPPGRGGTWRGELGSCNRAARPRSRLGRRGWRSSEAIRSGSSRSGPRGAGDER